MNYTNSIFYKSIAEVSGLPQDSNIEVAFAGRSNAGKSTALNTITSVSGLAKTSKTPGRTQLINFFNIDQSLNKFLVDLPGYGYAKVPEKIQKHWQQQLSNYLETRQSLRGIILLVDIRHPLKQLDRQMIEWCNYYQRDMYILLTKADKLTNNQANQALFKMQQELRVFTNVLAIQKFSAITKEGVLPAQQQLDRWFEVE